MKKIYLSMCIAALAMAACGGNSSKTAETQEAEATEQTTEEAAPETTASQGSLTFDDFSAQLKDACGVAPITTDKMTNIKVRKDGENDFSMNSPVSDESDRIDVQRNYFNAFSKVADGNKIYGFHMNSSPIKLGQNRPKQTLNQIV